jgi:hypothetical protein
MERYFFTEPSVAHVEDVLEGIDVLLAIPRKRGNLGKRGQKLKWKRAESVVQTQIQF